jgi:CTP synthase (UTP-ammonia lyase)
MKNTIKIGIIGDFNPKWDHHFNIDASLEHAAARLSASLESQWIPTESIHEDCRELDRFDGLWCSSGSPYRSMEGALRSIRYARENDLPFVGT